MDGEGVVQSELKSLIILFRDSSQQLRQRSVGEIYSNYKIIYWLPAPPEDLISSLFSSPSVLLSFSNLFLFSEPHSGFFRLFCKVRLVCELTTKRVRINLLSLYTDYNGGEQYRQVN